MAPLVSNFRGTVGCSWGDKWCDCIFECYGIKVKGTGRSNLLDSFQVKTFTSMLSGPCHFYHIWLIE